LVNSLLIVNAVSKGFTEVNIVCRRFLGIKRDVQDSAQEGRVHLGVGKLVNGSDIFAVVILYGAIYAAVNIIVDIIVAFLDPRIRLLSTSGGRYIK
ncbi:unnamed protein product, partial [marine sediment metagenome]